jgi:hypothetical protein
MTSKISAALCVGATLVFLAFAATPARASSRVFLREIKEATPGSALNPAGIAVDGKDDLWVEHRELRRNEKGEEETLRETLAKFGPVSRENSFIEQLPATGSLEGPDYLQHLAIEDGSEDFYVVSPTRKNGGPGSVVVYNHEGKQLLREWEKALGEPFGFVEGTVTVDNAPLSVEDPSGCALGECSIYVTEQTGDTGGILKFDSAGHPVPFTYDGECETEKCAYVSGNEITGIPGRPTPLESFGYDDLKYGLAVDAKGDIYAPSNNPHAEFEYAPSGRFLRLFDLTSPEVPPVHEQPDEPSSVAVDPVTHHLLVGVYVIVEGKPVGAIDEFETEGAQAGKFVAQITDKSGGEGLGGIKALSVDSKGDVYAVEEQVIGESNRSPIIRSAVVVYGPDVFPPVLTLTAATQRTGTGAQLSGTVNPNGFKLTECEFQYVPQTQFEAEKGAFTGVTPQETAACTPSFEAINNTGQLEAPHEVTGDATGLTPGDTYHYRLVAHNEEPHDGVAETGSLAFTAPAAPGIVATSAANLSSTFADLHAQIKPNGAETSYHFEYDTRPYGEGEGPHGTSVPIPDQSLGLGGPTGGTVESVSNEIGPLTPGTTYYYRVVANNAQGVISEGVCEGEAGPRPDCAFATLPAAVPGLPDGRAYELVTPATKEGGSDMFTEPGINGEITNTSNPIAPAESGEALLLETYSAFGPFPSAGHSAYVFRRDPEKGEWTYKSLADPSRGVQTLNDTVFDPADLSRVGVNDLLGSPYTEEGAREESLLGEAGGPYANLRPGPVFHEIVAGKPESHETTQVAGGSRDLSHVVLESEAPAGQKNEGCPGAEGVLAGVALCESAGGESRLVNVKPGSESEPVSACGARLGFDAATGGGAHQAVSSDGSRVFFTAPAPSRLTNGGETTGLSCWKPTSVNGNEFGTPGGNPPQLYARIDATSTLEISEPEAGVTEAGSPGERPVLYPAVFVGASEDGREVFFMTETWLTKNHPQGHDLELYECEILEEFVEEKLVPKCALTRVSIPTNGAGEPEPSEGANVSSVQAVASEGSAVYFLAYGALAPGATKLEQKITKGNGIEVEESSPTNLYRYQPATAGAPAKTTYVAQAPRFTRATSGGCGALAPCDHESWYTTPDGRYLLFASQAELTPNADNAGRRCAAVEQSEVSFYGCNVLYRYDTQAAEKHEQQIVCVSCNTVGVAPTGNALFTRSARNSDASGPVRAMSNNGEYVFFDTPTPLVPGVTNGSLNVYEWHDGTISLLNSGSEPGPSFFLGYSPYVTPGGKVVEGGNVFIGTHDRLVAADTNSVGNIYDARVCVAESPCIQPPPGETAQCEGASCQSTPVEPLDATPTSLSFSGPGDVSSSAASPAKTVTKKTIPKCKSGYARKKVKKKEECVKKPRKKSKAKKTNHGRAGR